MQNRNSQSTTRKHPNDSSNFNKDAHSQSISVQGSQEGATIAMSVRRHEDMKTALGRFPKHKCFSFGRKDTKIALVDFEERRLEEREKASPPPETQSHNRGPRGRIWRRISEGPRREASAAGY